jgi:hypothetical protein
MNLLIILKWSLRIVGAWAFINGILHTSSILIQKRPYDRHLIYLLMIGAILFFCGLLNIITSFAFLQKEILMLSVSAISTLFVLLMCIALLPIFPSIFTMILHLVLLIMIVAIFFYY